MYSTTDFSANQSEWRSRIRPSMVFVFAWVLCALMYVLIKVLFSVCVILYGCCVHNVFVCVYVYVHAFGGHVLSLATSWTWQHRTAAASHLSGYTIQQPFTWLKLGRPVCSPLDLPPCLSWRMTWNLPFSNYLGALRISMTHQRY